MGDLTVLYYTANRISDFFAESIRNDIKRLAGEAPIISVSFKPIDFGRNICIGDCGIPSAYLIYQQILIGAMFADTKYIICCEDDSMYTSEHFLKRPKEGHFAYNVNRWNVNPNMYYYRRRAGMCMCIAERDLLVQTLHQRFAKFPCRLLRLELVNWGEPGRRDVHLGLPQPPLEVFETSEPTLTFNHRDSCGGARKVLTSDKVCDELPAWGLASDLWKKVHG